MFIFACVCSTLYDILITSVCTCTCTCTVQYSTVLDLSIICCANKSYIHVYIIIILNIGPSFCVLRLGLYYILGHKTQVLYFIYTTY